VRKRRRMDKGVKTYYIWYDNIYRINGELWPCARAGSTKKVMYNQCWHVTECETVRAKSIQEARRMAKERYLERELEDHLYILMDKWSKTPATIKEGANNE